MIYRLFISKSSLFKLFLSSQLAFPPHMLAAHPGFLHPAMLQQPYYPLQYSFPFQHQLGAEEMQQSTNQQQTVSGNSANTPKDTTKNEEEEDDSNKRDDEDTFW